MRDEEQLLGAAADALKVAPQDLPERVVSLMTERRRLEQEISKLRQQLASGGGAATGVKAKDIGGIRYLAREIEGVPARDLRGTADAMLRALGSGVAAVVSVVDGKATLSSRCPMT